MWTRAIGLGVAIIGAIVLTLTSPMWLLPLVVPLTSPFMPKPAGVPHSAGMTYNWKAAGISYRWKRTLPHGCVNWSATRNHAYVSLSRGRNDCGERTDLSYFTSDDYVVFRTGPKQRLGGGRPCPFKVSEISKNNLGQLINEASAITETSAERAVLRRIGQRVSQANGSALVTDDGSGCNDLQLIDYHRPRTDRANVWP